MNQENLSFKENFISSKQIFLKKFTRFFENANTTLRETDCLLSIDMYFYFDKIINNF